MSLNKLNSLVNTLESHIENHDVINEKVSKASVAWHLDHSLKVINGVIKTLQKSEPSTYKNNFSFLGKLFFTLGFFPRGRAKAPKHVKPPETILKADLTSQTQQAKTNIQTITVLDENAFFKHPLFGNINKARVTRFLVLHTDHHLKIIHDILKD